MKRYIKGNYINKCVPPLNSLARPLGGNNTHTSDNKLGLKHCFFVLPNSTLNTFNYDERGDAAAARLNLKTQLAQLLQKKYLRSLTKVSAMLISTVV